MNCLVYGVCVCIRIATQIFALFASHTAHVTAHTFPHFRRKQRNMQMRPMRQCEYFAFNFLFDSSFHTFLSTFGLQYLQSHSFYGFLLISLHIFSFRLQTVNCNKVACTASVAILSVFVRAPCN